MEVGPAGDLHVRIALRGNPKGLDKAGCREAVVELQDAGQPVNAIDIDIVCLPSHDRDTHRTGQAIRAAVVVASEQFKDSRIGGSGDTPQSCIVAAAVRAQEERARFFGDNRIAEARTIPADNPPGGGTLPAC